MDLFEESRLRRAVERVWPGRERGESLEVPDESGIHVRGCSHYVKVSWQDHGK